MYIALGPDPCPESGIMVVKIETGQLPKERIFTQWLDESFD